MEDLEKSWLDLIEFLLRTPAFTDAFWREFDKKYPEIAAKALH